MIQIIDNILNEDNFAVFTHVSPDGDAIGSLMALTYTLNKLGKKADAYVSGKIPERLKFMTEGFNGNLYTDLTDKKYKCCISVDCADEHRLGIYKGMFFSAETTINIDHHVSNNNFAKYNYVVRDASSTGEMLFKLLLYFNAFDKYSASSLYGSIASDTGCFLYSNTSAHTHVVASKLIKYGADYAVYNKNLFNTNTKEELRLRGYVIDNIEYYYDDCVALISISDETLEKLGVEKEQTEGIIDILKGIKGVEVAVLLKQNNDKTKVSVRTNMHVDAVEITTKYGGGGHSRAAGCTVDASLKDTKTKILKTLEAYF